MPGPTYCQLPSHDAPRAASSHSTGFALRTAAISAATFSASSADRRGRLPIWCALIARDRLVCHHDRFAGDHRAFAPRRDAHRDDAGAERKRHENDRGRRSDCAASFLGPRSSFGSPLPQCLRRELAHLGIGILQQLHQHLDGRRVLDLSERVHRDVSHGVVVSARQHRQRRDGGRVADLAERVCGGLSDLAVLVACRLDQRWRALRRSGPARRSPTPPCDARRRSRHPGLSPALRRRSASSISPNAHTTISRTFGSRSPIAAVRPATARGLSISPNAHAA